MRGDVSRRWLTGFVRRRRGLPGLCVFSSTGPFAVLRRGAAVAIPLTAAGLFLHAVSLVLPRDLLQSHRLKDPEDFKETLLDRRS